MLPQHYDSAGVTQTLVLLTADPGYHFHSFIRFAKPGKGLGLRWRFFSHFSSGLLSDLVSGCDSW